jgi:hypothetical protein
MIAASRYFYQGNTLHGNELLSLIFWKMYNQQPMMQLDQFCNFLFRFKFETKPENFGN